MSDWEPFATDLNEDIRCGFISEGALAEVAQMDHTDVVRLAAMALTFWASKWSDRSKDLLRGVSCLKGALPPGDK